MINYQLPETLDQDIDGFDKKIQEYKNGTLDRNQLKHFHVLFGIYEQRMDGTYMCRIRCPAGIISPLQLQIVSEMATKFTGEDFHLTTRQQLQIHGLQLDDLVPLVRELKTAGLATRGGGGNTVRNIAAPVDAGINPDDVFDVTPYAIALTNRLINENDSWDLPRKYKIAFSASKNDTANATVSDLGFIAAEKNGQKGFKVYIAGGLGAKSQVSKLLFDFIPDTEVYYLARAVKNLFWKYGDRINRNSARLRFLWDRLGEAEFKKKFEQEYQLVQSVQYLPLRLPVIENQSQAPELHPLPIQDLDDYLVWMKRFVQRQKQPGLFKIILPLRDGLIPIESALKLGQFLQQLGDNVIRISKDQNFLLRNIPEKFLPSVYHFLNTHSLLSRHPLILDKIISCTGASTCKLGVCISREAAAAVVKELSQSQLDLDLLANLNIRISGCPNACGQHPVSDLGFYGKISRKGDQVYPAYVVVAGGHLEDGKTQLAERLGEVSAYNLAGFVQEVLRHYLSVHHIYASFQAYVNPEGKIKISQILEKFQ